MTPMRPDRRGFLGATGAALLWPVIGRAAPVESVGGTAFGTGWRVTAPPGADLAGLSEALTALFAGIDREMSPWRPDSALSRLNRAEPGVHPAGAEFREVARAALSLVHESGGAFDPTVGPLVARWGFGPIAGAEDSGPNDLSLEDGAILKRRREATLDLCGIAKGRALDRAAALAADRGIADGLIDLGGELKALGRHPEGRPWRVGVEPPQSGAPMQAVLHLPDGLAVATSGRRAQSYRLAGRSYGHIIDPHDRRPAAGPLASVSVLGPDAMLADGWATALFAAGAHAGPDLAARAGLDALFVTEGPHGAETASIGRMEEYRA